MRVILILWMGLFGLSAHGQQFTIEDIYANKLFQEETLEKLNWMNDGRYYTALSSNRIIRYDVATGKPAGVLFEGNKYNLKIDDYEFSADESKLILLTEKQSIYRRSFSGEYFIYSFSDKKVTQVSPNGRQSYVTFSPDNSKVAFVRDNNLYYVVLKGMTEIPVTTDGKIGEIIYGSSDWVYEEELMMTKAFVWSPDGRKLAYLKFNETNVKEYNLQYWDEGAKYPRDYRYKYPKAGEANSVVSVHIFDLQDRKYTKANLGKETDVYIPKFQWTKNPGLLSVMRLNRLQNKLDVFHVSASTGKALLIFYERAELYLEMDNAHDIIYLDNGTQFIFSATERDGYKHFYLHNMDGQHVGPITKGGWEVDEFIGLDQSKKTPVLYYTSTEDSPLERHFYKIDINGKGKTKLSESAGINSVDISSDFKYYIIHNESADKPKSINLMSMRGKLIDTLKNNEGLKKRAERYKLARKEFFTFETVDKTPLNYYLLKPLDFDSARQYPVLIYQYSGPGSQNVKNEWDGRHFYWHQHLVQKGYVVVVVDTRGTGGQGEAFKKQTFRRMGNIESTDLIEAAYYLGGLPFFDKNRIGIWGWSYGGYASSVAMMKGSGVFKTCIAVAPFSWEHYDTVYSERYMQRPEDNPDGYKNSSLLRYADKLDGDYLLIHGTGDDNVHYQVSINLINKLVEEGKQIQTFFYPDKAHSISGDNTKTHLYTLMTEFLEKTL